MFPKNLYIIWSVNVQITWCNRDCFIVIQLKTKIIFLFSPLCQYYCWQTVHGAVQWRRGTIPALQGSNIFNVDNCYIWVDHIRILFYSSYRANMHFNLNNRNNYSSQSSSEINDHIICKYSWEQYTFWNFRLPSSLLNTENISSIYLPPMYTV